MSIVETPEFCEYGDDTRNVWVSLKGLGREEGRGGEWI